MVHALREARRVLRSGGLLLDIRPALVHRRVGVLRRGRFRLAGMMEERFDDDEAADRAVADAVARRMFRQTRRLRFGCVRAMDGMADFREWLDHYVSLDKLPPHDWLVDRLADAVRGRGGRIVVRGPIDLRVLEKP